MKDLTLIPKNAVYLKRLDYLINKYGPLKMFQADKLYYNGVVYRLPDTVPAGNLSGHLFVYFAGADFTLYLKNGYLQPLGSFTGGMFTPSLLGMMCPSELSIVLEYLQAINLSQRPTSNG